ncbi:hypothetical protein Pelo_18206 [Pelomyxa schiedti]|nr:hypothetical protein Pelo_18206 [Pelomyxa schiedti]
MGNKSGRKRRGKGEGAAGQQSRGKSRATRAEAGRKWRRAAGTKRKGKPEEQWQWGAANWLPPQHEKEKEKGQVHVISEKVPWFLHLHPAPMQKRYLPCLAVSPVRAPAPAPRPAPRRHPSPAAAARLEEVPRLREGALGALVALAVLK